MTRTAVNKAGKKPKGAPRLSLDDKATEYAMKQMDTALAELEASTTRLRRLRADKANLKAQIAQLNKDLAAEQDIHDKAESSVMAARRGVGDHLPFHPEDGNGRGQETFPSVPVHVSALGLDPVKVRESVCEHILSQSSAGKKPKVVTLHRIVGVDGEFIAILPELRPGGWLPEEFRLARLHPMDWNRKEERIGSYPGIVVEYVPPEGPSIDMKIGDYDEMISVQATDAPAADPTGPTSPASMEDNDEDHSEQPDSAMPVIPPLSKVHKGRPKAKKQAAAKKGGGRRGKK